MSTERRRSVGGEVEAVRNAMPEGFPGFGQGLLRNTTCVAPEHRGEQPVGDYPLRLPPDGSTAMLGAVERAPIKTKYAYS